MSDPIQDPAERFRGCLREVAKKFDPPRLSVDDVMTVFEFVAPLSSVPSASGDPPSSVSSEPSASGESPEAVGRDPQPCAAPNCIDGTVFTHQPSWDDPGYEHGTPCPTCKGSGWVDGDQE